MNRTLQTRQALAPDGQRITFGGVAESITDDWFWSVRVTGRTMSIGITIGRRSYVQRAITREQLTVTQQITYRGQPLTVAATADGEGWFIGWEGLHRDLMTGGAGAPPSLQSVVEMLDVLNIAESPDGLVLRPLAGSGTVLWGMSGKQFVPGAGSVTIYPKRESSALVPTEPGLKVGSGEVWSKSLQVDGASRGRVFLHAGDTGVAIVRDDRDADLKVTDEGLEDLLGSLQVRWS
ncbi:MAG TPA: hypothetical protein VF755_21525 [Catenuloplanes sp.]